MANIQLLMGNEAIALGAVRAGVRVVTGYPGTPSTEIMETIARQPEARGSVMTTMFIGLGMAETGGIYGLLVAMILLFANPLVQQFIRVTGLG